MYTGVPSECDGAQWHDINFKYAAICDAPDAVLTCIEALANAVANPLLTLTKSGGLRFFPVEFKIISIPTLMKRSSISINIHRLLKIYTIAMCISKSWVTTDTVVGTRVTEILIGNLLNPPIIAKEVLFAPN